VLRRFREERGLSQEAVARGADLTVSAYLRIEGARSSPSWQTVRAIASALGLSMSKLVKAVEAERR